MEVLDFERPILLLEEKIKKLRDAAVKNEDANQEEELVTMTKELAELKINTYKNLTAWQKILIARHRDRPHTTDYIKNLFSGFIELHGDRNLREDKSMTGGFANFEGRTVMVIGQEKGRTTKEKQARNFGMNSPEGYRKSTRLMKLAEKFGKPVICFIDTPGASPGFEAEKHGQAFSIAQNIKQLLNLKVPVVSIIIGEGSSAGALALGVGDRLLMMEYTWFSVVSPETCSSMLWHDWKHNELAAEALKLTAEDLLKSGMIDDIIHEPEGGSHKNPEECYLTVKKHIIFHLDELCKLDPAERITMKLKKYTQVGSFEEK
jgi:acetyl-CoA carboxylase carboxyl transferase subunit alpha